MCVSVTVEYHLGTGSDNGKRYVNSLYVRENISFSSEIELPYFSVQHDSQYSKICIYCGFKGTNWTLNNSFEY